MRRANPEGFLASEVDRVPFPTPALAMDAALPRAALAGAAGGKGAARDQDPDDDGTVIASSPADAAYRKLFVLLGEHLDPDQLAEAQALVGELLGATDDTGNGSAMAADQRKGTPGYSRRFPNANRLVRVF